MGSPRLKDRTMKKPFDSIIKDLSESFNTTPQEFRGEVSFYIPSESLLKLTAELHDTHGFNMLIDITAVDYWPKTGHRFHVVYHFLDTDSNQVICIRVPVDSQTSSLPSISSIYANATWYEREVWDMFGLRFEGNPDMRRILMPHDWEGHPLRKDYPLGYEEVEFSINFSEIDLKKLHGKE
jgi:NADH-quinone oxidoreductase subunit C